MHFRVCHSAICHFGVSYAKIVSFCNIPFWRISIQMCAILMCHCGICHFGVSHIKCVSFCRAIVLYVILVFLISNMSFSCVIGLQIIMGGFISNVCHSVVSLCYVSFWWFSYQMHVILKCHSAICHFGVFLISNVCHSATCHFGVSNFNFLSFGFVIVLCLNLSQMHVILLCHSAIGHFGVFHCKCMSFCLVHLFLVCIIVLHV